MSGSGSGSDVGSGCGTGAGSGSGEGEAGVTTGEIITVVTVAMAVTLSFLLDALERAIRRFKYSTLMLKMMFRETMIVGLVSGILYTLERTDNGIVHDQVQSPTRPLPCRIVHWQCTTVPRLPAHGLCGAPGAHRHHRMCRSCLRRFT